MPGIVRVGTDKHVGHASPTPNPFHKTPYATGAANVFANGAKVVRVDDTTACTDPATAGSPMCLQKAKPFIVKVMPQEATVRG